MLTIVWAVEYSRSYVDGVPFEIISDHKALATVLKRQKTNETYSSRLTRRVDCLLPFEFEGIHGPGRTIGIADYISRNPTPQTDNAINANTSWNEWFTIDIVSEIKNSKRRISKQTAAQINQSQARTKQARKRKARTTQRHY